MGVLKRGDKKLLLLKKIFYLDIRNELEIERAEVS